MNQLLVAGLALAGAAAALGFSLLPTSYTVVRDVHVEAPPHAVFAVVSRLETRPRWSAWYAREPGAATTFSGSPGEVGATMQWRGAQIGEGRVTVTDIDPNRAVRTRLELAAPMAMTSTDTFEVVPEGMGSRVTWRNEGPLSGAHRVLGLMMDRVLGDDYETGLANLRKLVESGPQT